MSLEETSGRQVEKFTKDKAAESLIDGGEGIMIIEDEEGGGPHFKPKTHVSVREVKFYKEHNTLIFEFRYSVHSPKVEHQETAISFRQTPSKFEKVEENTMKLTASRLFNRSATYSTSDLGNVIQVLSDVFAEYFEEKGIENVSFGAQEDQGQD